MATHSAAPHQAEIDPVQAFVDQVRDAVASRAQRMDQRFPLAVSLEARVLAALHGELHGVASQLSGTHLAENFREALRGERSMPLGDLCRLATDPTREARAAAIAALRELARALGQDIAPAEPRATTVTKAIASHMEVSGRLHALYVQATADGVIDSGEKRGMREVAGQAVRAASETVASLAEDEDDHARRSPVRTAQHVHERTLRAEEE